MGDIGFYFIEDCYIIHMWACTHHNSQAIMIGKSQIDVSFYVGFFLAELLMKSHGQGHKQS